MGYINQPYGMFIMVVRCLDQMLANTRIHCVICVGQDFRGCPVPVQNSNAKISACLDLATQLLQMLKSRLCKH